MEELSLEKEMKVLLVFGTRPEAIKLLPLYGRLKAAFGCRVHTFMSGQSPDLVQTEFGARSISIDFYLQAVRKPSLDGFFGQVLERTAEILASTEYDYLIVQGDTTTAFAGALAGFNSNVKVVHIEAGLRSFDLTQPFPEEGYRQCISRLASYHFCPTDLSANNLIAENCSGHIEVTGNTVIDAIKDWAEYSSNFYRIPEIYPIDTSADLENAVKLDTNRFVLVTAHRRENLGTNLIQICCAVTRLAERYTNVSFIFISHKNPRVKMALEENIRPRPNLHLVEPIEYEDFLQLLRNCLFAISDSGGVQEEVSAFSKQALVTRELTERPEGINSGHLIIVGADENKIFSEAKKLLEQPPHKLPTLSPYGDGNAALRIVRRLIGS